MTTVVGEPALGELFRAIATATRLEQIYDGALTCLEGSLGVEKSSILLFDDDGVMRFKAWRHLADSYRAAVEGHSPWTPDTRDPDPVLVSNLLDEPALADLAPAISAEGIRALAFVPLTLAGRLLGKFMLYYPREHIFSDDEILTARVIASHVAFAIDQQRLRQELDAGEHRYRTLVDAVGVAIYTTDAGGHVIQFNEAAATLWGRRPEIGQDLWCGSWKLYSADGRPMPHEECPLAVTLRTGAPSAV